MGRAMNGHALLEARELTVRFGGLTAVDNVSAEFAPGALVSIIGPNGAGKTTLFNALSGLLTPSAGDVFVLGQRLTGARPHRYAQRGIARTFQTPRVFTDLSVAANIDFGLRFAGRQQPGSSLLKDGAGILEFIGLAAQSALPAGAITLAHQRLLEIGMALATRPRLLLLDEVAAGLTEHEFEAMARLIRRLRDELGLSIIWIQHAVPALLSHVERVIVLHQGRTIADGTPAEVGANQEVIEAYLGDDMVEPVAA
jgi:branched-chain amino acid transport system ATP-binding protein